MISMMQLGVSTGSGDSLVSVSLATSAIIAQRCRGSLELLQHAAMFEFVCCSALCAFSVVACSPVQAPLSVGEYLSIPGQDDTELELTTEQLVDQVTAGQADVVEVPSDDSDDEDEQPAKAVTLQDARTAASSLVSFISMNPNLFSEADLTQARKLQEVAFKAQIANLATLRQTGIQRYYTAVPKPSSSAGSSRGGTGSSKGPASQPGAAEVVDLVAEGAKVPEEQQEPDKAGGPESMDLDDLLTAGWHGSAGSNGA